MTTRGRRRSLQDVHEESPEQKSVSQRARELFNRHRKRLTLSGGRRSRPLDTLDELEPSGDNVAANSAPPDSPPKKAKRILGIATPSPAQRKDDEVKEMNENDAHLFPVIPGRRKSRNTAPLATLFDDPEDFSTVPGGDAEANESITPKTPSSRRSSIDRFFRNKGSQGTPLRSISGTIGRSLSAIRTTAGRSLHLLKVQSSVSSLNSIIHSDSRSKNDLNASNLEGTPARSSHSIVRQLSSASVTKAANAFIRGLVTGPRTTKSRVHMRMDCPERQSIRRSSRRLSGLGVGDERLQKTHERYDQLKSAIHVLKEEITELATADEVLYDAVVCDVTPNCKPISEISKLIMNKVGEEVIDDLDSELVIKKKFVLTESGGFKACKYIFFVVDYGTPGSLEKTWQDMRFVFHNIIEKAIEHEGITSLLLPYLYTGEPMRDQEKVANAAVSSINHLAQQMGLGNVTKLDIGGVNDRNGCYDFYAADVEKMLASMAPQESDPTSGGTINRSLIVGGRDSLNTTTIDDSFYLTAETSFHQSLC